MKHINRSKVLLILNWCAGKFGQSKFQDSLPKIRIYKSNGCNTIKYYPTGLCGYYNCTTNTIVIFLGTHCSIKDLCSTVIHEYKHYLQNNSDYEPIYCKLISEGKSPMKVSEIHPHEKKCRSDRKSFV